MKASALGSGLLVGTEVVLNGMVDTVILSCESMEEEVSYESAVIATVYDGTVATANFDNFASGSMI